MVHGIRSLLTQSGRNEQFGVIFPAPSGIDENTPSDARTLFESVGSVERLYCNAVDAFSDSERYSLDKLLMSDFEPKNRKLSDVVPATTLYEIALYNALRERYGEFDPKLLGGSSTGIFAAAVVSGSVSLEDMVFYMKSTINLIEEASSKLEPYGLILLKGVDVSEIQGYLEPGSKELTADTSPIKLSMVVRIPNEHKGREPANTYTRELRDQMAVALNIDGDGRKIKRIYPAEPGVHHSLYGKAIEEAFAAVVDKMDIKNSSIPILNPYSPGELITSAEGVRCILIESLFRTVRSADTIRQMAHNGVTTYVGVGPGDDLLKRVKIIAQDKNVACINNYESLG